MTLPIGKYTYQDTWIHKLDPRAKLASLICLMIACFASFDSYVTTFAVLSVILLFTVITVISSKTSIWSYISSLKSMWIMIVILLAIYSIMPSSNPKLGVVLQTGSWVVYYDSIVNALKVILRLFIILGLTMTLTGTTSPLSLTYALEWYLSPLKVIKFPASEVSMTISIALRFIPTLLEDVNRIMKSQESRGVDFSKGNLMKRIKYLSSLIVPLFVSAFNRSEDLANAMECRCYDPAAQRTRYRVLKWTYCDSLVVILSNIFMAGIIALSVINFSFGGLI